MLAKYKIYIQNSLFGPPVSVTSCPLGNIRVHAYSYIPTKVYALKKNRFFFFFKSCRLVLSQLAFEFCRLSTYILYTYTYQLTALLLTLPSLCALTLSTLSVYLEGSQLTGSASYFTHSTVP